MSNQRVQINTNGSAEQFIAVQVYLFSKGIGWSAGGTERVLYERHSIYHERGIQVMFPPSSSSYIVIGRVLEEGEGESFNWSTQRDEIEKRIKRLIRGKGSEPKDPSTRVKILEVPF